MRPTAFVLLVALTAFAVGQAPVVLAGTAPVPKHLMKEPENDDKAKLQGKWKLESLQLGKMPLPVGSDGGLEVTLEFRGDTLTGVAPNQTTTATIKLDTVEGLKRLSTMNTRTVGKDGKPIGQDENTVFGFVIDGGKLLLATTTDFDGRGSGRGQAADPKKPGDDTIVMVLVRVKDKE